MQVLFCLACQRRVRIFSVDVRGRKLCIHRKLGYLCSIKFKQYQNTDVHLQNAWIVETQMKLDSVC